MSMPQFVQGQILTAAELNALATSLVSADPVTGKLPLSAVPDEISAAIAAAAASAATALAAAQAATQAAAAAGGPKVVWAFAANIQSNNVCQVVGNCLNAGSVVRQASGRYRCYLASGVSLPPDYTISDADIPAFRCKVGGYVGQLPGGSDETVVIGGLTREGGNAWGVDADTGLSYVDVTTTYQAQAVGSTIGVDFEQTWIELWW